MVAHTVVVGANSDNKITDKRANCFLAAHFASQAALRLMRPGNDVSIIQILENLCFAKACDEEKENRNSRSGYDNERGRKKRHRNN